MDDIAAICARAELLLAQTYQVPISIAVREQFDSNHVVLRCAVRTEGEVELPQTLILKQRNLAPHHQPQSLDQSTLFRNEWASLSFLTSLAPSGVLAPRLYADDQSLGLVLLEDLGEAQSVQAVLYSADEREATDALIAMGTFLGQLQSAAYRHEPTFLQSQAALGASTVLSDASLDCRPHLAELHACLQALRIRVDEQFDTALESLEAVIHGPGPLRTFVHNDAGPHNFLCAAEGVRLLDFEFAGYGHGLLDVVCARLAFPPAFRGRVVPHGVVQQLEAAYRAELVTVVPMLADDEFFAASVCQACAHWAYSKLIGFWRAYLQERLAVGEARDQRIVDGPQRAAFFRRQVLTYLHLALKTLVEYEQLTELRTSLAAIIKRLERLWPETQSLPGFPAFGGESWRYP
jgi:aminoglycoside/choline kinase family phosphotransferase